MKKILLALTAFASLGFSSGYAQTILSQDFESTTGTSLPTGWSQISSVPNAWVTATSATFASSGFAVPAHTRFVGINDDVDSSTHNTSDTLFSPSFSLSSVSGAYLNFDISYLNGNYGGHHESFQILVSTDNGSTWSLLSSDPGNTQYYWETRHLSMAAYNNDANVQLAYVYSDGGGWEYGVALDNIVVNVPPAADLALIALGTSTGAANSYGAVNSTYNLTYEVQNNSINTVTSYDISYAIGSGAPVTTTVSGVSIPAFGTYIGSESVALPATAGAVTLNTWVTLSGDAILSNDSANTTLTVVPFMPNKRLMFEEGTGTWCGYCVRGIVYMDSIWELYPATTSIVSVHDYNGYDPMAEENSYTQHYDQYISSRISGYPSIVIDRAVTDDPSGALTDYNNMINNFGFATLSVTGSNVGGKLGATVNVTPAINLNGDYRLALVVTEDSVHGTASGYLQHNYYSNQNQGGSAGQLTGQGINYQTEPFAIPNEYYKFVDRYTIPDMEASPNGVANSLPSTMTVGNTYSYSFDSVTIASDWAAKNLRVIVMLIDNNSANTTYGQVLNSANSVWPLGVSNVSAGIEGVRLFPNPASQETYLAFNLKESSNVQVQVYDALGRVVYNSPAQNMTSGDQQITINTSNLAAGIYNVKLQTENGTVTQRLSVVR